MKIVHEPFDGVMLLERKRFNDDRGFFLENYSNEKYFRLGITEDFVQDNHSRSYKNVLRGLHYTKTKPQSQLLTVIRGLIFDVVVDIRRDSPTFGKWYGVELGENDPRQIYMAHGFAHGFCVLSDVADLYYKVSQKYDSMDDAGVRWNDPDLGIIWPGQNFIISPRDKRHPYLKDIL